MIFTEADVAGAYLIDVEPHADERGFFARTWCRQELRDHGLEVDVAQCSTSFNAKRATLRGLHLQVAPFEETKYVRCTSGAIHDVIVDLRPGSPTYLVHVAVQLTSDNRRMLYVPKGVAHGFQTLVDHTEVAYQMSECFSPEHARGVRWDDPAFGIDWPLAERIMNERDRTYPDYVPE
ncbi:MAG TPA: dTDP-4-dehydrorhamnose 3,5-epimerase [Ilumatobacteraceae bacterium]